MRYINKIQHPVVRALLRSSKINKGLAIHHEGDLPARSGIGSSSAFTVGLINSLCALKGKIVAKDYLAKEAIFIERHILKENVGSQDQVAVAYGGFNKILFNNDHNFTVEPITLHKDKLKRLQSHLMLFFTGLSRYSSKIAYEQVNNTNMKNRELSLMAEMVNYAIEILNGDSDIIKFGKLLHEHWQLKKMLSEKISNPVIEKMYQKALSNGAVGGKILGAGGGGFMLLFAPPEKQDKLRRALNDFLEVKFAFEKDGSQIIYYNP